MAMVDMVDTRRQVSGAHYNKAGDDARLPLFSPQD
jgi:hypothetical protein